MQNTLYTRDNLFVLNSLNSQSVDLIYLDPPFNSKRIYSAPIGSKSAGVSFKDMWTWEDVNEAYLEHLIDGYPSLVRFIQSIQDTHSKAMMAYVTYMTQRIIELHRILKQTGSFYLHCDPTASHYLKIVLDNIFRKTQFRGEIVWAYSNRLNRKNGHFAKLHDVILIYSKSNNYLYRPQYDTQWKPSNTQKRRLESGYEVRKGELIIYDEEKFKDSKIDASTYKKVYKKARVSQPPVGNVWDIPIINPMSKERTGYPTQKPLALLDRIIKASSKEGDIVFDPFCGCATTCVAAQQLNRKWIGIDIETKATDILIQRLSDDAGLFKDFVHINETQKLSMRTDVKQEPVSLSVKERLYQKQEGLCNGCKKEFDMYNFEVDHIVPKSKGGGDYYENYQLLCGNCNRVKGDRPMEYLRIKIKAREQLLSERLSFGE